MKPYNFYAGPAILPEIVLQGAHESVINFENTGLSILEVSHRSKEFVSVLEESEYLIRKLLHIPSEYAVLFLTGGASTQFFLIAMNLLGSQEVAGYIDTGKWSQNAIKEAYLYGNIEILASSKDNNYSYIPKNYIVPQSLRYIHFTTNNTIYGTEFHEIPNYNIPLIGDMSSNIFSKPIDIQKYDLIYAGAQKNLGPAGTTLVIVKKEALGKTNRKIPTMLDYKTHIEKGSSFNTPPVYPIYVSLLSLRWLKEMGGVSEMEKRNIEKATLLYDEIDRNNVFVGSVVKEDRSRMNVCFNTKSQNLESKFLEYATSHNIIGIKGHRSIGGFRASIYNAMSLQGVKHLINVMQEFEREYS